MVEQNPTDSFRRYGLAMEYVNAGDLLAGVDEFIKVIDHNPQYAAAYFHGAQTLEKLGRVDEAKGLYRRGIEVTSAMGDDHTCSELQAALDLLG
jgi:Tfp pilus assembly protein PilF